MLPFQLDLSRIATGNVKAFALFQMQMFRMTPPVVDYTVDAGSVLQNSIRLIQAFADVARERGSLSGLVSMNELFQCVSQGTNPMRSSLWCLPNVTLTKHIKALNNIGVHALCQLLYQKPEKVREVLLRAGLTNNEWTEIRQVCDLLPRASIQTRLFKEVASRWIEVLPTKSRDASVQLSFVVGHGDHLEFRVELSVNHGFATVKPQTRQSKFAYTPNYPKGRYEGWWCILGDPLNDEVIDFKRASSTFQPGKPTRINLKCHAPGDLISLSDKGFKISLRVASDVYAGLDQEVLTCYFRCAYYL